MAHNVTDVRSLICLKISTSIRLMLSSRMGYLNSIMASCLCGTAGTQLILLRQSDQP